MPNHRDCYFREIDPPCEGQMDRCHLIPKQRLNRLGLPPWDPRVWVWGCRKHHHQFDHGFIRLLEIPAKVKEYAAEHGVEWSLRRDYPGVLK